MGQPFGTGFSAWMEASEAKEAIVGTVSGGVEVAGEEESHLLSRKTTDFSAEIRHRLKNLGVVKSSPSKSRAIRAIEDGVSVAELVKMVSSAGIREDVYESESDSMSSFADIRLAMASQTPSHTRDRKSMVRHLMEKGLSEDEANKFADSHFGPRSRLRP